MGRPIDSRTNKYVDFTASTILVTISERTLMSIGLLGSFTYLIVRFTKPRSTLDSILNQRPFLKALRLRPGSSEVFVEHSTGVLASKVMVFMSAWS